jgi:hypothetical protein
VGDPHYRDAVMGAGVAQRRAHHGVTSLVVGPEGQRYAGAGSAWGLLGVGPEVADAVAGPNERLLMSNSTTIHPVQAGQARALRAESARLNPGGCR